MKEFEGITETLCFQAETMKRDGGDGPAQQLSASAEVTNRQLRQFGRGVHGRALFGVPHNAAFHRHYQNCNLACHFRSKSPFFNPFSRSMRSCSAWRLFRASLVESSKELVRSVCLSSLA